MVVSRQVADEMSLDILQSGGSLTRLEPWSMEKAEQVRNLGQSMEGREHNGIIDSLHACQLYEILSVFRADGLYADIGSVYLLLPA